MWHPVAAEVGSATKNDAHKKRTAVRKQTILLFRILFVFLKFCSPFKTYFTCTSVTFNSKNTEVPFMVFFVISPRGGVMS